MLALFAEGGYKSCGLIISAGLSDFVCHFQFLLLFYFKSATSQIKKYFTFYSLHLFDGCIFSADRLFTVTALTALDKNDLYPTNKV